MEFILRLSKPSLFCRWTDVSCFSASAVSRARGSNGVGLCRAPFLLSSINVRLKGDGTRFITSVAASSTSNRSHVHPNILLRRWSNVFRAWPYQRWSAAPEAGFTWTATFIRHRPATLVQISVDFQIFVSEPSYTNNMPLLPYLFKIIIIICPTEEALGLRFGLGLV